MIVMQRCCWMFTFSCVWRWRILGTRAFMFAAPEKIGFGGV